MRRMLFRVKHSPAAKEKTGDVPPAQEAASSSPKLTLQVPPADTTGPSAKPSPNSSSKPVKKPLSKESGKPSSPRGHNNLSPKSANPKPVSPSSSKKTSKLGDEATPKKSSRLTDDNVPKKSSRVNEDGTPGKKPSKLGEGKKISKLSEQGSKKLSKLGDEPIKKSSKAGEENPSKIKSPLSNSAMKSPVGGKKGSTIVASPKKAQSKKALPTKMSSVRNDDDLDMLGAEVLSVSSSSSDGDERHDTFDDDGPSLKLNRDDSERGGSEDSSHEEEDSDDDVVRRVQSKKDPRGLLAVRGRMGSGASSSGEESNDSDSSGDGDAVEDLFDETLAEIREQEKKNILQAAMETDQARKLLPVDVLREVPFFVQFSHEHQEQLFSELEEEIFKDGETIVKQGELGDKFYVIVEGEAVVSKTTDTGEHVDVTHVYPGDFFGELVLIYGGQRVATVTSWGRTVCMSLSRKSFEKYDDIRYFLILQKVPLLSGVPKDIQLEIVKKLKPAKFNKDDYVVRQGDPGDAFFMITKGSAVVIEDDDKIITRLYEGHSFGEMALLSDEPRVASVKAATELNLMYLSVEDFKELLSAEDFSKLLEHENKKIRELRDRRQWKRVNSVTNARGAMVSPQQMNPNNKQTDSARRTRAGSLNQRPAGMQQKLKTGKTSAGAKIVNNYVLGDQIGKGTFGVVRLCENVDTKEKFAIKIIDKSLFKNKIKSKHQTSLEDMRREAAIMKRLNHENVVNLIDVIDDPKADQLYLVQEYCERGAIMEKLDGNTPLNENVARKYFRDLLSGIDYLHAHSIIHRDIKPMNLLLTADYIVKIGDFGAARVLQGNQVIGIAGTPAFMAPELLGQDHSKYNGPAVDLWSCGATLFMLVTGSPPWMADDEPTLAKRVQNDELVFSNGWDKKLSPHLRNLLTRLLVKDPTQRMTLTATMEHEWVTEEGAEPLPRFVDLQPQLLRVNSTLAGLISNEETKGAITMLDGSETPKTPQVRKYIGNSQVANSSTGTFTSIESPKLSTGKDDPLIDSLISVDDEDGDDSERDDSGPQRVGRAESVDLAQYDIWKHTKRESETSARIPVSSIGKKKKMSVVHLLKNRVLSKERPRGRVGSTTSKDGSQTFREEELDSLGSGRNLLKQMSDDALMTAEEEEEEVSLSAMLADKSMYIANQEKRKIENNTQLDIALRPLIPFVPLVKARRGYHVSHCMIKYGYGEATGNRATMEDFVAIVPKLRNPDTFFAAIFDGHNGDMVAKELKSRFHRVLSAQPEFSSPAPGSITSPGGSTLGLKETKDPMMTDSSGLTVAIRRTCLSLDRAMLHFAATELLDMETRYAKSEQAKSLFRTKGGGKSDAGDVYRKAGSTAVFALIRGGSKPKQPCVLTVGWVGDSRAVLCRAGKPVQISMDHKAEREDEKKRIRDAGGVVDRLNRLYGDLAVSRAFGDLQHKGRELKHIVSNGPVMKPGEDDWGADGTLIALPDTTQLVLTSQDEFLILASDGIWDVMTNEQAVNFVRFHLHRHGDVRKAAVELVDKAIDMHSVDNVSAVVIGFVGKY